MTAETGGPAFPCHPGIENPLYDGMTLRDYFAAKAMQGDLIGGVHHDIFDITAKRAYALADEMLKARKA
jgi:hypothetical protein